MVYLLNVRAVYFRGTSCPSSANLVAIASLISLASSSHDFTPPALVLLSYPIFLSEFGMTYVQKKSSSACVHKAPPIVTEEERGGCERW